MDTHIEHLVKLYDYIYFFCLKRVHDEEIAKDITQDTFLRAIKALPTYEEKGTNIRAWLVTIAKNLVYDYHTYKRVNSIDLAEAKKIGVEDRVLNASDRLNDFTALPSETQKIYILLYVFDYSYEEVSVLTGKTVSSLKGIVFKANAKLKK